MSDVENKCVKKFIISKKITPPPALEKSAVIFINLTWLDYSNIKII